MSLNCSPEMKQQSQEHLPRQQELQTRSFKHHLHKIISSLLKEKHEYQDVKTDLDLDTGAEMYLGGTVDSICVLRLGDDLRKILWSFHSISAPEKLLQLLGGEQDSTTSGYNAP